MTDKERHLLHYLILVLGLLVTVFLFVFFRYDNEWQIWISFFGSVFYAAWGIIHHAVEDRLTKSIALEYVLLSSFVFLVTFTALSI